MMVLHLPIVSLLCLLVLIFKGLEKDFPQFLAVDSPSLGIPVLNMYEIRFCDHNRNAERL